MNDFSPRELRARDIRIIETREEIKLYFGAGQPASNDDEQLVIDTASQIILTPSAAKRFSRVLLEVLDRHESRHGLISPPAGVRPRPPRLNQDTVIRGTDQLSGAHRLIRLVDELGVYYGLEHSFKIFPGAILGDRVLLGFNHDELGSDAVDVLLRVCRDLGMPDRFQKIYRERLPESNIFLFGYEGTETGGIYKAYLEFSGDYVTVRQASPDEPASFPIHLGFKWDAADNQKAALAHYTCYPGLSAEDMLRRIKEQFYGAEETASFEIISGIVNRANRVMSSDEFLYLEVEEENNPRRSYDINMYRANLPLKELYSWLREACRIKGIGPETFHRFYQPMQERYFGHVSGGHDREGRDFMTFYYGVAGSSR